ncbi:prolyl-tRNA synthetase [Gorgonomyces haynaldii]|nr:prolyl-tRNA synthetase [Gorgonomyces haynaldii]
MQRCSNLFIKTIREAPNAQSVSHELLLKSGFIKQSYSGVYTLMPYAVRVIEKLEKIIDQELQSKQGLKIQMPCVLSSVEWKRTGRWQSPETFKLKDRKGSEFLLGPTHEEEVTSLVRGIVNNWRQLPLRLYQIGKKYRDELRPRSGLLRAREFLMMDMYTFDKSEKDALETYDQISEAYCNILKRVGVPFAVAEADTGSIGGTRSHEYHIVSDAGEDDVLSCGSCGYCANVEKAQTKIQSSTNGPFTIDTLDAWKDKTSLYWFQHQDLTRYVVCVLPLGRQLNQVAFEKQFSAEYKPIKQVPDLKSDIQVCVDSNLPTGIVPLVLASDGDSCPSCTGTLSSKKAIEVGHTFYLGTKYSSVLGAKFRDTTNHQSDLVMGCFGIGVSRLMAAVIEASHDSRGMIWPQSIAPFKVAIVPAFKNQCDRDYNRQIEEGTQEIIKQSAFLSEQERNGDLVFDDRDESTGYKLKDADLIGYPFVIVVGQSWLKERKVELKIRKTGQTLLTSDLNELEKQFSQIQ